MNPLDSAIAFFAPGRAVKRAQARMALRHYESAEPSRLRTIKRSRQSIDHDTLRGAKTIREAARWMDQNYDLALGALDVLVRNVVGTGIVPEPLTRLRDGTLASDFNTELSAWFTKWSRYPEVTGELDYSAAQRLKALTLFRDGESFTQYVQGEFPSQPHGTEVPFSIELIDPDYVPHWYYDPARNIVQGIGKNGWGKPNLYLVYRSNPRDSGGGSVVMAGGITGGVFREITSANMQHLKPVRYIRQTRGISVFSSALERIEDIRCIDESERVAGVIASSMAAYVRRGNPDLFEPEKMERDEGGRPIPREHKFQPGMIFDFLEAGEDIGTINTTRPNANLGKFRDDQLRAATAGIGAGFSDTARNWEGTYSSRRQEANAMSIHYSTLWSYFCERGERPTWERLVQTLVAARLVRVPRDLDLTSLYEVDFSRPISAVIDRQKEVSADSEALETFQDTLVDVWRSRGKNPADMWRKLADQAGKLSGIKGAAPSSATEATPDPTDNTEPLIEEAA